MEGVYNITIIRQRLDHIHIISAVSLKFDIETAQADTRKVTSTLKVFALCTRRQHSGGRYC